MNSLYSTEVVENKLDITEPRPFSLKVSIFFKDDKFKEYLLKNKNIRTFNIRVHGTGNPHISINNRNPIIYPHLNEDLIFMDMLGFIKEGSFEMDFKTEKHLNKAKRITSKKLNKFLSAYEKEFNKLKLFAENYENQSNL